jgi:hypothetical protein
MYPRSLRKHFWLSILILALLFTTTALVAAQSPDLHLPLVTGEGETVENAPEAPIEEEIGEAELLEQPDPAAEEAPVSIAAYNNTNWYVSGRMGVGTDLPSHKLSVIGGPAWTTTLWAGSIELANASAIGWRTNSAGQRFGMGHHNGGFHIFRTASNPGTTSSAATYDLTINNSGYVGIGTTTPAHKLSIVGGPAWTAHAWGGAVDLANESAIGWRPNNIGRSFGMGQTNSGFHIFRTLSAPGTTSSDALYDLSITDGGFVGLGITNPANKLHVNGSIRSEGDLYADNYYLNSSAHLIVPDYVFEPDYPLLSLEELRAFIAEEKHLPNVPSEEEIRAGSLDVTDFQMRLLEKTEELTLYTLAQDEQLQAQEEQIQSLQQVIAGLEARLAALEEKE